MTYRKTGDEMADHLMKIVKMLGRHGTPAMKASAERWKKIINEYAERKSPAKTAQIRSAA